MQEKKEMKYSILMPYYKRGMQLQSTLKSFDHFYKDRDDYEVIVIPDNKNNDQDMADLDTVIGVFSSINIKKINGTQGKSFSPATNYNIGARAADGEFLILTNPEAMHTVDILKAIDDEIDESKENYIVCSSLSIPVKYLPVEKIGTINGKWYQHSVYRNTGCNFCSVISKENYFKIGGFSEEYSEGIGFDDDDFREKVNHAGIKFKYRDDLVTLHLHHETASTDMNLHRHNENLYNTKWGHRAPRAKLLNLAKSSDPVYILIRTSGRPKFFANMMESIKAQDYPNIKTIVHTDNDADTYVSGDIIIKGSPKSGPDITAPYNLYCNDLLAAIPDVPGWYCFMDDDDIYMSPSVISEFVNKAKVDAVNVARTEREGGQILPKYWRGQKSFQTQCFLLHTNHKKKFSWWGKTAGDHNYTEQLTKTMSINWVDGLILSRSQDGKGNGTRMDLGQKIVQEPSHVMVYYLKDVTNPIEARASAGDIKKVPTRTARKVEAGNFGRIISQKDYSDFINKLLTPS